MERKILTVFIASPSDLNDERNALRDIVRRINKIYGRRIGWQVELLGWEDTLAGYSRPQKLINIDVESCELFIGMLWKKWGTDSGEYSSGFEEEFEIARKRRTQSDKPEIWMLFKRVEKGLLDDPGKQLKKVINFRKQLIDSKELLFKEFKQIEDFKDTVFEDLSAYLLDLYNNSINEKYSSFDSEHQSAENIQSIKPEISVSKKNGSEENTNSFNKIIKYLGSKNEDKIKYWDRVRSHLTTSALFSESHIGEVFGSHETNLVYRKREVWRLFPTEKWYLKRTLIGDSSFVNPGWYWFKNNSIDEIEELLIAVAQYDSNVEVRKGALKLLNDASIKVSSKEIDFLLNDANEEIVSLSIDLTKYCDLKEALKLLKPLIEHSSSSVSGKAFFNYMDLLYHEDPNKSFRLLKDKGTKIPNNYKTALELKNLNVDLNLIKSSIFEASPKVREYAADYLNRIGELTTELAEKLLTDTDSFVRKIGFVCLLNNGKAFNYGDIDKFFPEPKEKNRSILGGIAGQQVTKGDVIPLFLSKKTYEELKESAGYYFGYGMDCYKAFVNSYYSKIEDDIRFDLNDGFKSMKERTLNRLQKEYGNKAIPLIINQDDSLEKFVKDSFAKVALNGLALINNQKDLPLARNYLGSLSYGMGNKACISIIKEYGDNTDVKNLLSIARDSYGDVQVQAIEAALKLSDNKKDLLIELANDENIAIAKFAAEQIKTLPGEDRISISKTMIFSEQESVRLAYVNLLAKDLNLGDLRCLLDEYMESKRYYYNVVCFLDNFLNAPEKFRM